MSAQEIPGVTITITDTPVVAAPQQKELPYVPMREFFTKFCNTVGYGIPDVYKQIPLKLLSVKRAEPLYPALQKCVYLGFLSNGPIRYQWDRPVGTKFVNLFLSKAMKMNPDFNEDNIDLTREDYKRLIGALPNYQMLISLAEESMRGANSNYFSSLIRAAGFDNLSSIYRSMKSDYRSGSAVEDDVLVRGAIKGMTDAVGDMYTVYFPPAEAQQFNEQLQGSFEGIGAYLDMVKPGEIVVTSVLKNTPAQSAGVMANDRIVKVGSYTITEKDTLESIIGKIKGPAGTKVELTVKRDGGQQVLTITRAKITLSLLDYEVKQ